MSERKMTAGGAGRREGDSLRKAHRRAGRVSPEVRAEERPGPAARQTLPIRGRGAAANPPNRFERIEVARDEWCDEEDPAPQTVLLRDSSRTILSMNDSPDIPFTASLNPYRGCEHGCAYCYARPTHEYLGFSAGLDFEWRILVKQDAPALLRRRLASPRWRPQPIAMSGVTDPYQPVERRLRLTRGCLEVLAEARNPVAIITKNHLVTRDVDLLSELARHGAAAVYVSVTTLDLELRRVMEPRTSVPQRRLDAIAELSAAGVPVGVMVAPVIPGLTDHEMPSILEAAARAGARRAAYIPLRLPHGVADLFGAWLERHFPERRARVLNRIREIRDGRLNDPSFGTRMRGTGVYAAHLSTLFEAGCRRAGIDNERVRLSTSSFRRPSADRQLPLL